MLAAVRESGLEEHAEVLLNDGEETVPVIDFRRTRDGFIIHAGESEKQAEIDKLEKCTADADTKAKTVAGYVAGLSSANISKTTARDIIRQINEIRSFLEA